MSTPRLRPTVLSGHHASLRSAQPLSLLTATRARPVSELLRCRHCGEVIGVYEPLVSVKDDRVVETSRAVDPNLSDREAEHYHRACFDPRGAEPSAAD